MNKNNLIHFRFNGSAFDQHTINAFDLAPVLLGLAEICRETNYLFNQDKSNVDVLIRANIEQNCFELGFELIEAAKNLLFNDYTVTAKEILEWIGIIVVSAGGVSNVRESYLEFMAWLGGRKIKSAQKVLDEKGKDNIKIEVSGDGNNIGNTTIIITPEVFKMTQDPKILNAASKLLGITQNPDCDAVQFIYKDSNRTITKEEAKKITMNKKENTILNILEELEEQTMTAYIKVYAPVYDPRAEKWRFEFGDKIEYIDISDTSIANDAIKRGGALVEDTYKVILAIKQHITDGGKISNEYKVKKVLDFFPASKQGDLFFHGVKDQDGP